MPRDGSGTYSQPFPPVTEGTTIESTVYNGYTADVTLDLNSPRPISSGGTGASNAADAMAALGGEGSKIEVLNYDSHAFTAGSFYSKASATSPPIAGHAFAGICYVAVVSGIATSDMFIEVRDRDEATQPGSLFVRQKKNGTWSGWLKAVGTSMGATPPAAPTDGVLWWDPTRGKLFIYYSDPDTAQWVEAVATPDMNPDDFVRIDADQVLTETEKAQGRENISAAPFDALGWSGMQVNGSFDVSQELGVGGAIAAGGYACDGWVLYSQGGIVIGGRALAGATPGFSNYFEGSTTTALASLTASALSLVGHNIEGYRSARLAFGNAAASPVTIGFWTAHFRTGLYCLRIGNPAGTRSYVATYTHSVSNVWEYHTITIPGDTVGTWSVTNTTGLTIEFIRAAGTDWHTASPNTWLAGNFKSVAGAVNGVGATSDYFRLTGVVVLPGTEAPTAARSPLIMRPYDQELVTCRRYWRFSAGAQGATANVVNKMYAEEVFDVPMRAAVSVSPGGLTSALIEPNVGYYDLADLTGTVGRLNGCSIVATPTVAFSGTFRPVNIQPGFLKYDARL